MSDPIARANALLDSEEIVEEIRSLLDPASDDERRVILYITRRLMTKGRKNYGPLDVRADDRDFGHEMSEEAIDALVYWAEECIRKHYRSELDFDDEQPTGEYSPGIPNTWSANLGSAPIEIAVARTDSSEFPVAGTVPCEDCGSPAGALHRAGCPFTVIVDVPEAM